MRELRSVKRCSSSSADGPPALDDQRAHLVEAGVDEVLGVVDPALVLEAAAGRERGPAHDAGRPDVAEHAPFVAEAVHQTRFAEQLVELRAVLVGYLPADVGNARVDVRGVAFPAVDGQTDRAQQRVGQLERIAPGDIETVEQPTPDEVEIVGHRRADIAAERAQLGERLAGVTVGIEERGEHPCHA